MKNLYNTTYPYDHDLNKLIFKSSIARYDSPLDKVFLFNSFLPEYYFLAISVYLCNDSPNLSTRTH